MRSGGVIAFPTETVYGIGALLSKPRAIARIYKIKKRARSKPLQALVASLRQAKELGVFNKKVLAFAKKRWPGPLTLIVPAAAGNKKIGLRMPAHRRLLQLIRKTGPIAATSANISGEKPFLTAKEVKQGLKSLDYVIPGRVKLGRASKIIDATAGFKILRH